jgi:ribosomal protein S18 acetylase RimI-like enzyme
MPAKKTKKKNFKVRKAEIKDLPAVVSLWKKFMAHHHDVLSQMMDGSLYRARKNADKEFAQYLLNATGDPDWLPLVATVDGKVKAYILASVVKRPRVLVEKKFGFISDIIVAEDFRRMGIANALFKKTIAWFKQKKIKTVELNVLVGNEMGEEFWNEKGFQTVLSRKALKLK